MDHPTQTGKKRYPTTDGYYDDYFACTCNSTCPQQCLGKDCDCDACSARDIDSWESE